MKANQVCDFDAAKVQWTKNRLAETDERKAQRVEQAYERALIEYLDCWSICKLTVPSDNRISRIYFRVDSRIDRKIMTRMLSGRIRYLGVYWVFENIDADTHADGGYGFDGENEFYSETHYAHMEVEFKPETITKG